MTHSKRMWSPNIAAFSGACAVHPIERMAALGLTMLAE
jgi:hypothetical protein